MLDGGDGNDTLIGGGGNDVYVVDEAGDVATEASAQGTDTVQSAVAFTLGSDIENLTLTGSSNINGTGNTLNNNLTGNSGANTLDGGAGTDTMIGGAGDDIYIVAESGDSITESSGAGTDLVQSSITYTISANIENLTLTGSSNINGSGSSAANIMTGNSGANTLTGGLNNDTLIGGAGNDFLHGEVGHDIYQFGTGFAENAGMLDRQVLQIIQAMGSFKPAPFGEVARIDEHTSTVDWTKLAVDLRAA